MHNRLQAEKNLLQTAVQACEAAASSISRPGTPLTEPGTASPEKEIQIKLKLEELIDQVTLSSRFFISKFLFTLLTVSYNILKPNVHILFLVVC